MKPEFLSGVRDDTLFRSAETDAFYHLMKLLKETDEKTLEAASTGPVTFTQLFTQPKEYRGELVTVAGTLRRNERLAAPRNKYGIEEYFVLVIQPDDRAEPLLIYCLQPPDNLPQGENLRQPITATGFFYKRQAGMSGDGLRTWPLVLAKTVIAPVAPPAAKVAKEEPMSLVTAMVGSVCVGLLVVWFVVGRTKRGPRFHLPGAGSPEAERVLVRDGLSELKNEEIGPDVRERLELLRKSIKARKHLKTQRINRGSMLKSLPTIALAASAWFSFCRRCTLRRQSPTAAAAPTHLRLAGDAAAIRRR